MKYTNKRADSTYKRVTDNNERGTPKNKLRFCWLYGVETAHADYFKARKQYGYCPSWTVCLHPGTEGNENAPFREHRYTGLHPSLFFLQHHSFFASLLFRKSRDMPRLLHAQLVGILEEVPIHLVHATDRVLQNRAMTAVKNQIRFYALFPLPGHSYRD